MPNADVLLTGAGSFIGSHVLPRLAQAGLRVAATVRSGSTGRSPIENVDNVSMLQLDLASKEDFSGLPKRVNTVIHLAAASSGEHRTSRIVDANVNGTRNLIDYALSAGAERFVFASSLSVHGTIADATVTPDTPVINPDAYGASKWFGEELLRENSEALPSVAIRLPAVLGRGAKRHWLSGVLDKARKGEEIEIFNPNAAFNNAISVDALSEFFVRLCRMSITGRDAFPIASAGRTTIRDAVSTVLRAAESRSVVRESPSPRTSFVIDTSRAVELGFRPGDIVEEIAGYVRASL